MDFDIKALSEIAIKACLKARDIYDRKEYAVTYKSDNTPATSADLTADHIISEGLKGLYHQVPIISEEQAPWAPFEERRSWRYVWRVDPIDGTKEFINRNG
jgi:3'(2'), 5'-bisphosphate nucleotidase